MMLKAKQGSISVRSFMSTPTTPTAYGYTEELSPDEAGASLAPVDLEIGLPIRRPPRKLKRSSLSKMVHRLQQRHKVSAWMLLLGAIATTFCVFYVVAMAFQAMMASAAPSLILPTRPPAPLSKLRNLVMVAGHAVYTSTSCEKPDKEGSWFLESYQNKAGQASTFLQHIKAGVDAALSDENALLLFSGGETRKDAGPRSEAQSYWSVAESMDWFGSKQEVRWRALTEEYARDSFENLLFSICRFKELTDDYPQNITVVSYDFKEYRFANLHRLALRFPSTRLFFKGTSVSPSSAETALKGETNVQMLFQEDPYGCVGPLHSKRIARDPFARVIPYPAGCPELKQIFAYCGLSIFPGNLPWD